MPDDAGDTTQTQGRWLRRTCIAVLLIFFGALANILVVVILSCTIAPTDLSGRSAQAFHNLQEPRIYVFLHRRFGVDMVQGTTLAPHLEVEWKFDGTFDDLPEWIDQSIVLLPGQCIARGWPFRAAHMRTDVLGSQQVIGGWETNLPKWQQILPRVIPYTPLWRGIIINTLFYAAVLWVMWMMYIAIRNARRRRRNLCPDCKYDLRGAKHDRCPECGVPCRTGNATDGTNR